MARGEPRARGEVAEVRAALASLAARGATAPDAAAARRDLFKKIVHYTTIGIDLSSLFMQVRWRGERGGGRRAREKKKRRAQRAPPPPVPPFHA
jgi:hypothetical protein